MPQSSSCPRSKCVKENARVCVFADDIISRSVTTIHCKHLVVDAGHISITSELASKDAIRQIQAKRKKQYTDADYKHLESMMYDRLKVQLEAAQVRQECAWLSDPV